ncbi:bifunctional 4-hydroxy-2-oxoglutarate aldolase/2-dehydro-3-deoxy-phosphogluconate aldolase [Streptomyces sp. NPDC006984]|uniref:bifunctional 4-hydroxy-2-oxoglutarate aldolase/2-dehydro-3-deoxy-phosphogluconate aldolase n=1 Tax=Streptomyces sp. NPDC006984 TaxID=3155463 RepID=UPI0033C6E84C
MTSLTTALAATPVVAILRSGSAARFPEVAEALCAEGVRAVEFTLTTPGVLDILREFTHGLPEGLALGAGTVTTPRQADQAVAAGARYLITPAVSADVIREARRLGVPVLPGAVTPTEILSAWQEGATMVKLFPASFAGGPAYVRTLRAPLPQIPLVPTGGISVEQASAYIAAGAQAVGMGSPLVGDACEGGDLDALRERAARLVSSLAGARR